MLSPKPKVMSLPLCLLLLAALLPHALRAATNLYGNVPEASNYALVYEITNIPSTRGVAAPNSWNVTGAPYNLNIASTILPGSFTRVAYYMELQRTGETSSTWVYVSMDAFTTDASKIGVPTLVSGALFQANTVINNANIFSNAVGITTGTGIGTVRLEFWPSNYSGTNGLSIPGAAAAFDFGDSGGSAVTGYGSMQIHNIAAGQTLFALNSWGATGGGQLDLGIGNRPSSVDTDWTFAANAGSYTIKSLQVLALVPEPSRAALLLGGMLATVLVGTRKRFSVLIS